MIAITSHRLHSENSEYRINQIKALDSWAIHFDTIFYLGAEEPELKHKKVSFVPSDEYPRIKEMIKLASNIPKGYTTILNADIILGSGYKKVVEKMESNHIQAGTSRRWNFQVNRGVTSGRLTDFGLDVFVATQKVWATALRNVPNCLRLGHIQWDAWLVGFLNTEFKRSLVDFTNHRVVFHPEHKGRISPFNDQMAINDKYIHAASIPGRKL